MRSPSTCVGEKRNFLPNYKTKSEPWSMQTHRTALGTGARLEASRAAGPFGSTFFKLSFTPHDAYVRLVRALTKQEPVSVRPQHLHKPRNGEYKGLSRSSTQAAGQPLQSMLAKTQRVPAP